MIFKGSDGWLVKGGNRFTKPVVIGAKLCHCFSSLIFLALLIFFFHRALFLLAGHFYSRVVRFQKSVFVM